MIPTSLRRLVRTGRKHPLTWQYLFNCVPTMSYKMSRPALSPEAQQIVNELNRHGVAITSAESLLKSSSCYAELLRATQALESDMAESLNEARNSSEDQGAIGRKVFNVEMLGRHPSFDPASVFARFALQDEILGIANAYFKMFTNLRYYNVWHTFATNCTARESQLWHRDREDYRVLKLFLYLSDVDESAGPFNYVMDTHPSGSRHHQQAPSFMEGGVERSNDAQMAQTIPEVLWKSCTGPQGTIVFADTRGYHKGGFATVQDRIMYTCMFTSPASESERLLQFPSPMPLPSNNALRHALREAFQ